MRQHLAVDNAEQLVQCEVRLVIEVGVLPQQPVDEYDAMTHVTLTLLLPWVCRLR